jgi:dimethylargininase
MTSFALKIGVARPFRESAPMFTQAIVRPPCVRFAEGLTTLDLGVPNYERALRQHVAYCEALEKCGLTLTRLEADEAYPDSTFVEDTAVIAEGRTTVNRAPCAILTRPGTMSRAGEVESIATVLFSFCPELHSLQEPGTLDGGDVCQAGEHFFIGISERTNQAGAQQLAALLAPFGYTSSFVDIQGMKDLLHLKSGLASLGDKRLAVIDALAEREEFRAYDLVRVNASEQYAANCVRVNGHVLVAAGYPRFELALQERGYKTLAVETSEFQKMDGGLSCLSLRF